MPRTRIRRRASRSGVSPRKLVIEELESRYLLAGTGLIDETSTAPVRIDPTTAFEAAATSVNPQTADMASSGLANLLTDTVSYLDNGTVRLGVNLSKGGAITYLSPSASSANMINNHDLGRQIQQSYYSGPADYHPAGTTQNSHWSPWPWNPIQSGDSFGYPGQILQSNNSDGVIYTRSMPMQWALSNVPGDAVFEQWSRLEGSAVRCHVRLTLQRSDTTVYSRYGQELPAVYTVGTLYRPFAYTGTAPFTGGVLEERPHDFWGGGVDNQFRATEGWAALVNDSLWGLGVRHPDAKQFTAGYYSPDTPGTGGEFDDNTGYIAPNHIEVLDYNLVYEYDFDLIVGTLAEIRQWVYDHPRDPRPDYRFQSDRQHWYCSNTTDTGIPSGYATVSLAASDPYMTGAPTAFRAEEVGHLFITARYNLQSSPLSTTAQLFWETDNVNPFSQSQSVRFNIIPDGHWHTYDVHVAAAPTWQGLVSRLRLDPVDSGRSGETVDLQSISYQGINGVLLDDNAAYAGSIEGHAGENVRLTTGETVGASTAVNGLVLDGGDSGVTLQVAAGQEFGITSGTLIARGTGESNVAGAGRIVFGATEAAVGEGFAYVDGQLNARSTLTESTAGMWLSKGGSGTLTLFAPAAFSGGMYVHAGTLAAGGSNVLPDVPVTLEGQLRIEGGLSETVGAISSSAAGDGLIELEDGSWLAVNGSTGTSTYYGRIAGAASATLAKTGTNTWQLRGTSDLAGQVTVDGGAVWLIGAGARMTDVARWTVKSGTLGLSNGVATTSSDRLDHQVSLQGGELRVTGPAEATAVDEVIGGILSLERGRSMVTLDPDTSQTGYGDVTFAAAALIRTNRSTGLVRGDNLGQETSSPETRLKFALAPTLSQADGSAATLDEGIIPYLYADTAASGSGSELVTYDPAVGMRTITAYASTVASGPGKNVKLTADETLGASAALRVLMLSNSGTAVRLIPGSSHQFAVVSGAIASTGTVNNQLGTSVADGGTLTFGPNDATGTEGIFHLRNNLVVYSRIVDNGVWPVSLTKDGAGALSLANGSAYSGGTMIHQGALAANNSSGSATGGGPVEFVGGSLTGGNTSGTAGFIDGLVTLKAGSMLAPGGTTAILTLRNGLTLDGGKLAIDVRGNAAGTGYDQVRLTGGDLRLENQPILVIGDTTGLVPAANESLMIVNNTGVGATVGQFAGLGQGSVVQIAGADYRIDYYAGDGNDVALVRNAAPVLDPSGTIGLMPLHEDQVGNSGTLVSEIIASNDGDPITDIDAGALEGIAIIAAATANGSWQYSTDGGTLWYSLGTPSDASARLLASDATTRIRFLPSANWNGTVDPAITFRAWDQTLGANGGTANAGVNGDPRAFSAGTATASIAVDPVNDEPAGSDPAVEAVEDLAYAFSASDFAFSDAFDNPPNGLGRVKVTTIPSVGSLSLDGVSVSPGQYVAVADINLGRFTFTGAGNANGSPYTSFTFQVEDDGGTAHSGVDLDATPNTVSICVASVNDPPAVAALADNPDPVSAGQWITLVASGVSDALDAGGLVVRVDFYRESNGTAGLQTGASGDALVGSDPTGIDSWSTIVSTSDLEPGSYTYYAQALDNEGAGSATGTSAAATANTVDSFYKLNIDGNGRADALTDGILILRYLFDPEGQWNYSDALGSGATRTSRAEIKGFLDSGQASALDADANGAGDALTDGILILRYLFDPDGNWNYSDALGSGATRTTREAIKAFLDQFNPSVAHSAAVATVELTEELVTGGTNQVETVTIFTENAIAPGQIAAESLAAVPATQPSIESLATAVTAHLAAFEAKCARNRDGTAREFGVPVAVREANQRHSPATIETKALTDIVEGLTVTGPAPHANELEDIGGAFDLDAACADSDPLADDQSLFFLTPGGIVVLLGCSHPGISNTLRYIQRL